MKAAIFNPYWDSMGGGERYTLGFVQVLIDLGYSVDIEWSGKTLHQRKFWQLGQNNDSGDLPEISLVNFEKHFGISLENTKFVKDIKRGDGYDVCFWVSDGSIPLLRARQNILHFQFPFKNVGGKSLLNKMKMYRINHIICNSYFTKKVIDTEYGINSTVIYPPVDVQNIKPKKKVNTILGVNRFSQLTQAKRQDILVDAFKKFYKSGFIDWNMILAGGNSIGSKIFVRKLKRKARRYPIKIIENPKYKELKELYGTAKIFWSASGFGVDEKANPKAVEHFGITIVEALASGCGVFALDAGGHKEIIAEGYNGYLWRKKSDLVKKTSKLISDPKLLKNITNNGIESSKIYEYERFSAEITELLVKDS